MPRVFYSPPPGSPPLEYESSGVHVFMPPDQYWTRVKVPYLVTTLWDEKHNRPQVDPRTGKPKEVWQSKKEWVKDDERNKLLEDGHIGHPRNFIDMTDDDHRKLITSPNPLKQYLVVEKDLEKDHQLTLDNIRQKHEEEAKALDRQLAAKNRKKRLELEAADRGPKAKPYPDDGDEAPLAALPPKLPVTAATGIIADDSKKPKK